MRKITLKKSPVRFDSEAHRYWLGEKELHGITSTLIKRAFPNKYDDIPEEVLANAARKGHELHAMIEFHDRFNTEPENIRIANYDLLKEENNLTVIANEYLVSDEQHYASSIDMVALKDGKDICLVDFKTTWNLDKESCALQLSIYKRLFEMQNKRLKVKHIFVIWLPNKDENTSACVELGVVPPEQIDALIEADLHNEPLNIETPQATPYWYDDIEREYKELMDVKNSVESRLNELKSQLMEKMKEANISQIKSDLYTVSYIPAKVSKKFDSTTFKKENKELYERYQKESETAASIRFLEHKQ